MQIATTDDEITAAVARWLDAHGEALPAEPVNEPIVRFQYSDGTGGSIGWRGHTPHEGDPFPRLGLWLSFTYRTDRLVTKIAFSLEMFRDSVVPLIPVLHHQAIANLAGVA